MSWIPFRKQPKKQSTDTIVDKDFDYHVDIFNKDETNTRKMYKDSKRFVEGNAALMKSHQKLSNDLIQSATLSESDKKLINTTEKMHEKLLKQIDYQIELNSNIRNTFNEPMKKFNSNYASVSSAIKRREQSLQDYTKYANRREKYMDNAPTSGKFDANERYLALAKSDFERRHTHLITTLPTFYELKQGYFEVCFQGLVESKYRYLTKARDLYEELAVEVDCPVEQWNDEEYREESRKRLNEIKALSIVAEK